MTERKVNVWTFVKTNSGSILLTLYIVGSLLFILVSFYKSIIIAYGTAAYEQGRQETILSIAQEVQKLQCQPLLLNLGQQGTLNIVNATCVQNPLPQQPEIKK